MSTHENINPRVIYKQAIADSILRKGFTTDENFVIKKWKEAFILRARAGDLGLALDFAVPWVIQPLQTLFPEKGFAIVDPVDNFIGRTPDFSNIPEVEINAPDNEKIDATSEIIMLRDNENIQTGFSRINENTQGFAFGSNAFNFYRRLIHTEMKVNQASSGGEAYCNTLAVLKVASDQNEIDEVVNEEQKFVYKVCLPKNNPWFIIVVTILQIIILIFSLLFGGITSAGVLPEREEKIGMTTMRGISIAEKWTPTNVWIGPKLNFLIRLGAVYSICLRRDNKLYRDFEKRSCYNLSEPIGCCLLEVRDIAASLTKRECELYAVGAAVWHDQGCSNAKRLSIRLRPCCHGLLGQCSPLIYEDCAFLEGTWFRDMDHCREINCLKGICGASTMPASIEKPFLPISPNQIWRFFISLFIHAGVLHLFMVIIFQWLIGRSIEQISGAFRVGFVYFVSGIVGNLIGAFFDPLIPNAGATPSLSGLLGLSFVESYQAWKYARQRLSNLVLLIITVTIVFISGTFQFVDNFANLGGLILGILSGLIIMPYLSFNSWTINSRRMTAFISLIILLILLISTCVTFYTLDNPYWCDICSYFSCIDYYEGVTCNRKMDLLGTTFNLQYDDQYDDH